MTSACLDLSPVSPVPKYAPSADLWVITTYFNPCRWQTRRNNYDIFIASLREAKIPCITVECAFGDDPFELPDALDVIQVRCGSVLWQKERLLNLAASWLPPSCRYIAWLDCDILFMNQNWACETAKALESHAVVQVFNTCIRLGKGNVITDPPDESTSFGAITPNNLELLSCGRYDRHGHTGYGWAMRREIFDEVGLYEHAVSGSADHFMAHAIYNEYGFCVENALKHNQRQIEHLKEWGDHFYALVQGSFTAVSGEILHLWHGNLNDRRYFLRMHEITDLGFNPYRDIVAAPGKPLAWDAAMEKPRLKEYFMEYFRSRKEDG